MKDQRGKLTGMQGETLRSPMHTLVLLLLSLVIICAVLIEVKFIAHINANGAANDKMNDNTKVNNMSSLQIIYENEHYFYDGTRTVEGVSDYLKDFTKLERSEYTYSFVPETALENVYFDSKTNVIYSYPAIFPSNGENAVNIFRTGH